MTKLKTLQVFTVLCHVLVAQAPQGLSALKARNIGPAGMSGRVAAIDATPDAKTIWVGAATGGLWRSTGGGVTWKPMFDDQPVSSIGAIAIDPRNPDVVWVGTGEGNPRNSSGVGYGMYLTRDGGRTWTWLGLEDTEKITRVVLDPRDPDVAYVSALGTTWGSNHERGVFKTTDGGTTWEHILFVDDRTGCADLVMDPKNPDKLIAAMWTHRRHPWHLHSGGAGSGIWITHDGGTTWERKTEKDGLPKGDLGRIGLAIAKARPNVVYALIEAKRNVLMRSEDGGHEWAKVNDTRGVNPRPFYYADIRVDPTNENRVYRLASSLTVSEDGGKSFKNAARGVHPDHHALWISQDGETLINGSDGGVAISRDRGKTWRFAENLPLAQFYHVATDDDLPFNVYGGLQDNGSWKGPSRVYENGGIRNHHWREVGFGDGFATVPLPGVEDTCYCMSQGGNLMRSHYATGERRSIRPDGPFGVKLRFNWNAGIALDPFDPAVVFYGSQFVHRSPDRGGSWDIISPDLTTNDPEKLKQAQSGGLTLDVTNAENFCSILTIAPSTVARDTIWVGTDDGQVHVTTDGGATWANVVGNIPDLAAGTWCPHIEASKHDPRRAYAVFDDHRRSSWTTYVYRTDDLGKTWTSLANVPDSVGAERPWGFVHVIEEDPVNPDLLWLGTEFGLWWSRDGGASWMKWTDGVPTAPVRALHTHGRDNSLVIATHGRAAYVIDDVTPLRELTDATSRKRIFAFTPPILYDVRLRQPDGTRFTGDALHRSANPSSRASLIVWLGATEDGEGEKVAGTMQIFDGAEEIADKEITLKTGINRVTWDLRRKGGRNPASEKKDDRRSIRVLPGEYTVVIQLDEGDGTEDRATLVVRGDPREGDVDRTVKARAIASMEKQYTRLAEGLDVLRGIREDVRSLVDRLKSKEDDEAVALLKSAKDVLKAATELYEEVVPDRDRQGIHDRGASIMSKLSRASRRLQSSWGPPSKSDRAFVTAATKHLDATIRSIEEFVASRYKPLQERARGKVGPLLRDH